MCYEVLFEGEDYDGTNQLAKVLNPLISHDSTEIKYDENLPESDDECLCIVDLKATAEKHNLNHIEDDSDPWFVTLVKK
jgi:hypothetical protein